MTKTEALETLAQVAWLALYEQNSKFDTDSLEEALEEVGAIREAVLCDMRETSAYWKYYENSHEQSKSEG